jgi:hypothetical protein
MDNAALDLRHRLLNDDEDVAQRDTARTRSCLRDERSQIVTLIELGNAEERDDADFARHGRPVTRKPAWPR